MSQHVPILVYHHVYSEGAAELSDVTGERAAGILGVEEFTRHLDRVDDDGWQVVGTSAIVDWLGGGAALPDKALALHFDNGWLDTFEVVHPLLRDFGCTATCYPITDGVEAASGGRSTAVRTLTEGVVEKPFMTWEQIGELRLAGWEIGAHTATHCKLADRHEEQGDDGVVREAEVANELFERRLGFTPSHFAYPSGSRNERTDQILAGYYDSLRLWHFEWPIRWSYTRPGTSPLALDCQNLDVRVPFDDFCRILAGRE
jgi:peptidoglycan/xylan/chitin deacetylase (PgdA/CDA1 family)